MATRQPSGHPHVRFGSQADIGLPSVDVRFTPESGDEKLTYISKGIADDLTGALARNKTFDVITHNRICGDGDDPRLIVRELGVGYLIIYGLRRASDEVRLSVRLIESYVGPGHRATRGD